MCRCTHLPKLFGRVFAAHSLEDFGSARMFIYETTHLVHIAIDDHVQALFHGTMLLDFVRCELFRHDGWTGGVTRQVVVSV